MDDPNSARAAILIMSIEQTISHTGLMRFTIVDSRNLQKRAESTGDVMIYSLKVTIFSQATL